MALVANHRRSPGHDLGEHFGDATLLRSGDRFEVFVATEAATDRRVFVKVVRDSEQRWLAESLDDQAAILGALSSHPNVITLFQRLVVPHGRPALVLEHSPVLLSDVVRDDEREDARVVTSIGIKLAAALDAVHRIGVLHCDVRPGNVLRTAYGEPVLAGFDNAVHVHAGIASYAVLSEPTSHTAPELLLGEEATPRTDVYGLAATLYDLLAGRSAFRAYADESPSATVARVLDGRVTRLVGPDIPLALSDLLTWALSPRAVDRPPSTSWLAEELRRIETEQGWPRTPFVA
ncbi:protein kinase [Jatrophihabitans endophyticus]|uniref:protein kinase domain-containing protein n=1 Tax=Jatrophihabitans endophyticus TaxID=1206085 RepID=UPI0019EF4CA0|nr:protein kinase [Jatrophihabitans endophyticus]MBE7187356.1 protein kinase [Jatrophihabitans endophyticus]